MKLFYGDSAGRKVSERIAAPVADMATLKGIPTKRAVLGMIALVIADGSYWQFADTSVLADDGILVARPSDGGVGAWLRVAGEQWLDLPFTFNTADAANLLTVPAGCVIQPLEFSWKVATSFTGGATPAIGISSSTLAGKTTKGDLLGGATGDVTATLVSTGGDTILGTIGANWATIANRRVLMKATDTIRFDRIASAFTAGVGSVKMSCNILKNLGA